MSLFELSGWRIRCRAISLLAGLLLGRPDELRALRTLHVAKGLVNPAAILTD